MSRAFSCWPGSIPTSAGKPILCNSAVAAPPVHPHECGETDQMTQHAAVAAGPSPRVRETHQQAATNAIDRGPSPRVRGNLLGRALHLRIRGSIPTSAGKPRECTSYRRPSRVHPHECGETYKTIFLDKNDEGPSPRVRGNQDARVQTGAVFGSIPTSAGKPEWFVFPEQQAKVHPHECGETRIIRRLIRQTLGPSPRVRGNRHFRRGTQPHPRSIPTSAGKPALQSQPSPLFRVHPHECGETY